MRKSPISFVLFSSVLILNCSISRVNAAGPQSGTASAEAWVVQDAGTKASLRGVSVVNEKIAWASGSQGTFLRTIDGGKIWQSGQVLGAEKTDFRDIEAFDADRAIVMSIGRPGRILKTTDGGKTWTELYNNNSEGIFLDAMAFFDENNAVVVGDPMQGRFFIIITSDGGKTWKEIATSSMPEALADEGAFAASGTCLTVSGKNKVWFCSGGPAARVFYSEDKGLNWKAVSTPLARGKSSMGGFSLAFLDGKLGVLVGGDYRNEPGTEKNAALTSDGGRTWELIAQNQPSGFRECVAYVPGNKPPMILAAGPSGSDYSLDGGKSWTPIPGPTGFHSVSVSKADGAAWAVGKNGLVAKFNRTAIIK